MLVHENEADIFLNILLFPPKPNNESALISQVMPYKVHRASDLNDANWFPQALSSIGNPLPELWHSNTSDHLSLLCLGGRISIDNCRELSAEGKFQDISVLILHLRL